MAKTRKDVDAFQKAMLSNTKVIGSETAKKTPKTPRKRTSGANPKLADSNIITQDLLKKYEALANNLGITQEETIKLALSHFLELEDFLTS